MKKHLGFTLIELLVAVAIFAVLSAMGWKVFDYVAKVKDRNTQHEARLVDLQQAYQQVLRDSLQIVPVNASRNGELEAALVLNNGRFVFSKIGVTDPLQQGMPPTERVEYQYKADEKKLYRLKYPSIHQRGDEQPLSSVLLERVDRFELVVLNPEVQTFWPSTQTNVQDQRQLQYLPKGIQIKFSIDEVEYQWVFSLLNTDYLRPEAGVGNNTNQESTP